MRITQRKRQQNKDDREMKNLLISAVVALGLSSGAALAAGGAGKVKDFDFSFEGPFGSFDQAQLQRGYGVYQDVCSACHGLRLVAFRNLGEEGGPKFTEDEVKAIAASFDVYDETIEDTRPGKPSDKFPGSNVEGAPDLSLMAKARAGFHGPYGLGINQMFKGMGGPEYIASLLTGYTGVEKEEFGATLYENTAFSGGKISMAPPLSDGAVEFADGSPNDVKHMAEDVSAFLMWAAEPKMMARKWTGLVAVSMLLLLTLMLYLTNKHIWAPVKRKEMTLPFEK